MSKLTDKELLEELQYRFSLNKKSLEELSALTKQLHILNNRLRESEKIKSQFLANIRNEMNNPLTSILGLSENIQSLDANHGEKTKSMAALIHAEAFNLDFQLKNIFAAAELESGEPVLEIVKVDVYALVKNVLDMYSHRLKGKQIKIKYTEGIVTSGNKLFKTDPNKLQLILSNLLSNAIEYSYPQSKIAIKVSIQKEAFQIVVQDFGIGIHKTNHETIFAPFTQLNQGSTKLYRGHGLGLSVTKALLEILSGKIHLKSTVDEGSTFTVSVPESICTTEHFAADGNELFFTEGEMF